jgi:protein-tyrosine phosphatase
VDVLIDLHCHLLPGIDDGAKDLETALAMARVAVADGIRIVACTPHILPGMYPNTGRAIRAAILRLQVELDRAGIPLCLVAGADVHAVPHLLAGLRSGDILPLGSSRYFLLEPPQDILPPRFESFVEGLIAAGTVPIITHPERLGWMDSRYELLLRAVEMGAWTQVTAGSILGKFGRRAQRWAMRMLEDGLVHIVASDAHDPAIRAPQLSDAVDVLERRFGRQAAMDLVVTRPAGILRDARPDELPLPNRDNVAATLTALDAAPARQHRRVGRFFRRPAA